MDRPPRDVHIALRNARDIIHNNEQIRQSLTDAETLVSKAHHFAKYANDSVADVSISMQAMEKIYSERHTNFPWLSKAAGIWHWLCTDSVEEYLRHKKNPARKAADIVRNIKNELRDLKTQNIRLSAQLQLYERLAPWLSEFSELEECDEATNATFDRAYSSQSTETIDDPAKYYVSDHEYNALTPCERNQLALDRFRDPKRKKTKWQVGLDYERYIGYLYENEGHRVNYYGATEGIADLGRDLVATRNDQHFIIQCKYWRDTSTLHEKHVFQTYGTAIEYFLSLVDDSDADPLQLPWNDKQVKPVIVTSTILSAKARNFADRLNVEVRENLKHDHRYPCIKCNVGKTGEKIYHLPFDQQYDKVVIEPNKGEFYAADCLAAEAKGFRRAYRWQGGLPDG